MQPLAELLCFVVSFDANALSRIKLPDTPSEHSYGLFLLVVGGLVNIDHGHR
jgi:hypothetical protein